jgi:hypothetical protein
MSVNQNQKLNELITNVEQHISIHQNFLKFLDFEQTSKNSFQYGETFGMIRALEVVLRDLKSIQEEK